MKISVVICSHNRSSSLQRTLQSLCVQTLPAHEFEVLVIDNASTDDTKSVTESFTDLPIRFIYEAEVGLSRARNTGWQAASAEYIAFLDDDAIAAPTWLEQIVATFKSYHSKTIVVGGRVELALPIPQPAWLNNSLRFCLGELRYVSGIHTLNSTSLFLPGCNMAFCKATLDKHNGFTTRLGRKGSSLLSGEEILLQRKILADGGDIIYNDQVCITHCVEAGRLTKKWFVRRMYWEGVSNKKIERLLGDTKSLYSESIAFMQQVFSLGFILRRDFSNTCTAARRLGRIRESIKRA